MPEEGKGIKRFKKHALVVLATTNSEKTKRPLRRQASNDPSAMDVLNTFVDESLTNSPLATMARNKCDIPDALMLEG
jgi:hypothetical protein